MEQPSLAHWITAAAAQMHGGEAFGATTQDAILKLFGRLPKGGEGASRLQTLLFSATLHSPEIRELATKICQNPVFIDLKVRETPTQPPDSTPPARFR